MERREGEGEQYWIWMGSEIYTRHHREKSQLCRAALILAM